MNKANGPDRHSQTVSCAKSTPAPQQPVHVLRQIQDAIGNRAVGRHIQTKLKVSEPHDAYEQEADRIADQVMRMPDPSTSHEAKGPSRQMVPQIQRMCADCEEEEEEAMGQIAVPQVQRKCGPCAEEEIRRMAAEEEEEESIQRKTADGDATEIDPELESGLSDLGGGGQPLSESVRSFFEPRFGQSFSDVRIHTGAAADKAAKSINAKAYTLGNNIAFASGEHDFSSDSGRRLMAHELTHTLQQSAGAKSVQRGSAGIFGGKCCARAQRVEWALVGAGVWKKLEPDECTGTMEDCDGMTCGGGFYHVDNGQKGVCKTPRSDDAVFAPRRWTPTSAGASARSPTQEGSTGGDTPPNYVYDSAATAQCPNGVRTITVDLVQLHGATQSPAAQLAGADTVYSSCCVRFVAGATPPQESQATTEGWLGGDTDVDRTQGAGCGNVGGEEQAMFDGAAANHGLSSRMRVFFVASFSTTGLAYSIPPYCATGVEAPYVNHAVVGNSALNDTLAHEFGHILLNNDAHAGVDNPADTRNLMFAPGRTASDLDPTQCATVFGNA